MAPSCVSVRCFFLCLNLVINHIMTRTMQRPGDTSAAVCTSHTKPVASEAAEQMTKAKSAAQLLLSLVMDGGLSDVREPELTQYGAAVGLPSPSLASLGTRGPLWPGSEPFSTS